MIRKNAFRCLRAAGASVLVLNGLWVACKTAESPSQESSPNSRPWENWTPRTPQPYDVGPDDIQGFRGEDNDNALSDVAKSCKDWSYGRTKLSCKAGVPLNGIGQVSIGIETSNIAARCRGAIPTPKLTCEGRDQDWRWLELLATNFSNPFDCGHGWYTAGVSFVEGVGHQGVKSLLCVRGVAPRKTENSKWNQLDTKYAGLNVRISDCGTNKFVRGIKTEAIRGADTCRTHRRLDDSLHPRCDRVTEILCCQQG